MGYYRSDMGNRVFQTLGWYSLDGVLYVVFLPGWITTSEAGGHQGIPVLSCSVLRIE